MTTGANRIFGRDKALIGMIHVRALPGTPRARLSIDAVAEQAAREAAVLVRAGFDALVIENMHDAPYMLPPHGPEIVAAMTAVGLAVRRAIGDARPRRAIPLGVQVLSAGNREALAIALAIGARFIRAENFVFAHVADEGLMSRAEAGPLLRYRREIGAEGIAILADIKKKHAAHAITADVSLAETAEAAGFFGADGVIVTGAATGKPAALEDAAAVRAATALPVLIGSGVTPETAPALLEHADGLIVGSWYKRGGRWDNPPDERRARAMVRAVRGRVSP